MNEIQKKLLSSRVCDLSLSIQGTRLGEQIDDLYEELETAGISFKPKTYLTDEWGCPHGVPVIGIPFYLADPDLCRLEGQMTGIEAEEESETMLYLRHEAGHAFNYAYRLYRTSAWRRVFGKFSLPYQEVFRPVPFSGNFVRHIPGWYAQKHPDDDFAETFAVWLTPGSDWEREYADSPALTKLKYVEEAVIRYGRRNPAVTDENPDTPVQDMRMTLETWYETGKQRRYAGLVLSHSLDIDLRQLFPAEKGQSAADMIRDQRRTIVREINRWTGINRRLLDELTDELADRAGYLGLHIGSEQIAGQMVNVSVFVATLAMNYQCRGKFVDA